MEVFNFDIIYLLFLVFCTLFKKFLGTPKFLLKFNVLFYIYRSSIHLELLLCTDEQFYFLCTGEQLTQLNYLLILASLPYYYCLYYISGERFYDLLIVWNTGIKWAPWNRGPGNRTKEDDFTCMGCHAG